MQNGLKQRWVPARTVHDMPVTAPVEVVRFVGTQALPPHSPLLGSDLRLERRHLLLRRVQLAVALAHLILQPAGGVVGGRGSCSDGKACAARTRADRAHAQALLASTLAHVR